MSTVPDVGVGKKSPKNSWSIGFPEKTAPGSQAALGTIDPVSVKFRQRRLSVRNWYATA